MRMFPHDLKTDGYLEKKEKRKEKKNNVYATMWCLLFKTCYFMTKSRLLPFRHVIGVKKSSYILHYVAWRGVVCSRAHMRVNARGANTFVHTR